MAKQTKKPKNDATKKPKSRAKKTSEEVERTPKKRQNIGDDWDFKQKVVDALKASLGIISNACIKCKISRPTFYKWYKEDDLFREAVDEVNETQKDFVEGNLLKRIKEGDTSAIIFYCKSKMKDRGYSERVELTGADGGAIQSETTIHQFSDVLKQMAGESPQED